MENADYWGLNPRRQPSKARSKASASYLEPEQGDFQRERQRICPAKGNEAEWSGDESLPEKNKELRKLK
jgi:hypothetical protein